MPQGKYFRIGYGIIVVLLIIFLASKVNFIFRPFLTVIETLLLPMLLSVIMYYLLRPVVNLLEKQRLNRPLAIGIVYLALAALIVFIIMLIGPIFKSQIDSLMANLPELVKLAEQQVAKLQQNEWAAKYLKDHQIDLTAKIPDLVNGVISNTGNAFNSIIGFVSNIVLLLSTVPFIAYYMLKTGNKVPEFIIRLVPDKHDEEARQIMLEMDNALSAYIQGKILVSLGLGILMLIGYLIIGLPYALLLAIVFTFLNVIPYVGVLIGAVPSVIVAFIDSPWKVVETIIVILIAQQIEDRLLSPQIMGKKLDIHPLTIIIVLLCVGSLFGLLGMFVAVPTYALLKVVVTHLYRIWRLRRIEIIE
ncbi:AI-2E family transporter [Cohnella nanjingensis]|uniref:AI-2E family transporter n=1 Tax=Cohnella nanjingensis TaxID=1387779 RepID=A0A7X0RYM3_9BACL|nr:AI-2E family transporter [Cohnella nanjingensis]MBB6674494.1 AI-2E family transporter [Cohnella nanjingensis]